MIINPGDYKGVSMAFEGAQPGPMAYPTRFFHPYDQKFGIYEYQMEKWRRDKPTHSWSNWELGFRVRGNFFDVDWTLLYWNARDDGPVISPSRLMPFSAIFIKAAMNSEPGGQPGLNTIDWPDYKVFYFKRYTTIGGTFQYYAPQLWDVVLRSEWYFEIGRPMNKAIHGEMGADIYDWTNRNILGVAFQVQKYLDIPGWTRGNIARGRMTNVQITYGWEKIFNHDHDLVAGSRNHTWRDSVYDVVTMFVMQEMFHNKIIFIFVGNYYLRAGKWMAVPLISYVFPGWHWRLDGGYAMHGKGHRRFVEASDQRDRFVLRLRYEF
jgi:hypothetical protein